MRSRAEGNVRVCPVGQPSAPPPSTAIAAAREALTSRRLGYTETLGIAPLRARIALHYREIYDIDLNPLL